MFCIKTFFIKDMNDLEAKIRDSIAMGDTKTGLKWKKIVIIVEGVYSMEGTIANLPELIRLKKKYKCYLYVDEAHSIGAIGPNGRGITDFYGCDANDIDLLMGTLTKSFGASGGYIAGRRHIIDHIRTHTHSSYATNMSAPIAQQIISVIKILMGETDGTDGIFSVN
jgi:serine palmitoyltransferase